MNIKTSEELYADISNNIMSFANVDKNIAYRIIDQVLYEYNVERKNVIEASGQYVNGRIVINLSSIWTRLIKEAARRCDYYASDLLIDIETVEEHLETFIKNNEEHTWLFGFRQHGVDGNAFIEQRGINSNEYLSIWSLTLHHIESIGRDSAWFYMTLKQE